VTTEYRPPTTEYRPLNTEYRSPEPSGTLFLSSLIEANFMKRGCVIVALTIVFLSACKSKPDLGDLVRDMVVMTNYDKSANFSAYSTYTMLRDTIGQIFNADPSDSLLTGDFAKLVSRAAKTQMDSRGYSFVERGQGPDLALIIVVVRDFSQITTLNSPYYGGSPYGYGYGYPSFYGYGGYYSYPYLQTYTSNTATLMMELVDLKNRSSQNQVRIVWSVSIGDVINSDNTDTKTKEGLDQAFAQSPYLHR
jgi:hypothetical protein